MKAAVFYGKHNLKIEEFDIPKAGADEAVIKVMACGTSSAGAAATAEVRWGIFASIWSG